MYRRESRSGGKFRRRREWTTKKSPNPVGKSGRLAVAKDERKATRPAGTRALPRRHPRTRSPTPSPSHSRLLRRRSAPDRKAFLSGSRRTTGSEVLCNYREYRLVDTDQTLDYRVYATTRKRVKYLLVVMGEYKFSGVDPIRVISFLARCKEHFHNANMTEAMALMAPPHLLAPPAKEAYESQRGLHHKSQGIATWAAAVNWLLRTCATNLEIERALTALRELRQKPGELETEYATRISTTLRRCGDVHSAYERTTFFMEGLTPAIKPLVLQAREDRPRSSFEDTVAYARSHGDAFRA